MNVGKIFKPDGVIFVHCPNCIFSTFHLEETITCKGHDTVVSLSAGDDKRPAEA